MTQRKHGIGLGYLRTDLPWAICKLCRAVHQWGTGHQTYIASVLLPFLGLQASTKVTYHCETYWDGPTNSSNLPKLYSISCWQQTSSCCCILWFLLTLLSEACRLCRMHNFTQEPSRNSCLSMYHRNFVVECGRISGSQVPSGQYSLGFDATSVSARSCSSHVKQLEV